MPKAKVLSDGILYRNENPGFKAEYAFLPNILPLSETEALCFYRVGAAFYSIDGRLATLRSTDGGRTWAQEAPVWDPKQDDADYSYSAPHATRLRDGTLLVLTRRVECSDPDRPLFNPETGGHRAGETLLFRSEDDGRTWAGPEIVSLPYGGHPDTPSQIIELNDGRWFMACEMWKTWDDTSPLHIKGFGLYSDDRGKTWSERVDFPSASNSEKMFSHSRYTQMLDGRIAALQWTQNINATKEFDLHFTVSDESGTVWSDPRPTGIKGQTSWLADMGDGLLVATYTSREGMNPGIRVVVSDDAGKTWDLDNEITIWDAVGQEYLGAVQKPTYPASHDNIAFGKPNSARMPNGEIISSWWCTQACVTHARFARLAVE